MIFNPTMISGGGGGTKPPAKLGEVNFYDYDGTLVAGYTLEEAQALTALPDGPTHEGLTFQGWNRSLDSVKALTRPMNVGAMYITDDGATRLYIRLATEARNKVPLYIAQTVANGVSIDWGDGSTPETLAGTGYVNTTHTYTAAGDYVITLRPGEGCELGLGMFSSFCVMGSTSNAGRVYCNMLQRVEIGIGVTNIGPSAFSDCSSLSSISLPKGVNGVFEYSFQGCYSLSFIALPEGLETISEYSFMSCRALISAAIPEGVTTINRYVFDGCNSLSFIAVPDSVESIDLFAFQNCWGLSSITIAENVSYIEDDVFKNCYGMKKYHARRSVPPGTNDGSGPFGGGIPADCIIYVPKGSLAAYQTASQWSAYASKMREEGT